MANAWVTIVGGTVALGAGTAAALLFPTAFAATAATAGSLSLAGGASQLLKTMFGKLLDGGIKDVADGIARRR